MTAILSVSNTFAVLLTAGYEERTAVSCIEQLRKAGLSVSIVGINDQLIRGRHGIHIAPDYTIASLPPEHQFHVILISGGCQHVNSMLTDPRIHKILHRTINANGFIAPFAKIESLLFRSGFSHDKFATHIIKQDKRNLNEYINQLIQLAGEQAHCPRQ